MSSTLQRSTDFHLPPNTTPLAPQAPHSPHIPNYIHLTPQVVNIIYQALLKHKETSINENSKLYPEFYITDYVIMRVLIYNYLPVIENISFT